MDLKIKDVAELLNVSETTIRRWLKQGKIPAYRLNNQYRFSRMEIEDWVLSQKLTTMVQESETEDLPAEAPSGHQQYSLYRAIYNGGVYHDIPGHTKEAVIQETMQHLSKPLDIDPAIVTDLLLDREHLMPTALNNGIGIPHTRDFIRDKAKDVVAIVFPKEPIDYGALDGKPVHTLFFLFASSDKMHLHLLAKIAHLSSQTEALQFLASQPTQNQLLRYIKEWEHDYRHPFKNTEKELATV